VYLYSASRIWTQLGNTIQGETAVDNAGSSVALGQIGASTILAIGANGGGGRVRMYTYADVPSTWIQMGKTIEGVGTSERFGSAIALSSDGSTLISDALFPSSVRVYSISYSCAPTSAPAIPETYASSSGAPTGTPSFKPILVPTAFSNGLGSIIPANSSSTANSNPSVSSSGTSPANSSGSSNGISTGGIVGIAFGAALVVAIAIFVGWKVGTTKHPSASNGVPQSSTAPIGPASDTSAVATLQPATTTTFQTENTFRNNSVPSRSEDVANTIPFAAVAAGAGPSGTTGPRYKDQVLPGIPVAEAVAVEY
jgi:hypothetical protein